MFEQSVAGRVTPRLEVADYVSASTVLRFIPKFETILSHTQIRQYTKKEMELGTRTWSFSCL